MIETINVVNKEVSKLLGIDEQLIKIVNQHFWKQGVKASIQSGLHTSIRIKNIGTLATSRLKVNNKIKRLINTIRSLRDPNRVYKEKTMEQCVEQCYIELRMLCQRRNDIAKAYKTNKDRHKHKYELYKASLGEQTSHNARSDIENILLQTNQTISPTEIESMQILSIQQC